MIEFVSHADDSFQKVDSLHFKYVENVLKLALGEDKAASVLRRILPSSASKGLEILSWMDARSIAEMIRGAHPQVVAIILSVLEYQVGADVLAFLPEESRA